METTFSQRPGGRREDRVDMRAAGQAGFTLLEVMVVIIIIGLLAGIVGVAVIGRVEDARVQTAYVQMRNIRAALKMYSMDNGFYPETEQTLQALIAPPTTGRMPPRWKIGGYLDSTSIPLDPWGNPYYYLNQGEVPFIFSAGPDGQPNTADDIIPE